MSGTPKLRIAVVAPLLARFDAISCAALDTYRMLSDVPDFEVSLITRHNEFPELTPRMVHGPVDLLLAPEFMAADVAIYHFGFYNEIFDVLPARSARTRQILRFHNVTPAALLRPEDAEAIEKSLRQMQAFRFVDRIWADSPFNRDTLLEHGLGHVPTQVLPLVVDAPARRRLADKAARRVEILFVGRFVRSKGVLDALKALAAARDRGAPPFRIRLVGNMSFSHETYLGEVRDAVTALGDAAELVGTVDDEGRDRLFADSHLLAIPSYHEGFCKPVLEALRAGCAPVGYNAGNLPHIAAGLGRLVAAGDIDALATAFGEMIEDMTAVVAGRADQPIRLDGGAMTVAAFDDRVQSHIADFAYDRVRAETIKSVRRVAVGMHTTRRRCVTRTLNPVIRVLPDDEMREAERTSLNRLPDYCDWDPTGELGPIMLTLRDPVTIHRKSWEYALCVKGLSDHGVVRPDSVGLGVGAGYERPLYHFANEIAEMVATDLYDETHPEGKPLMLTNPQAFAPFPYREDRLKVMRMPGEALDFADESFDFVFCLSSIEHFGSRATQARSFDEMARVTRPGGVVCIITELILTEHSHHEYFRWDEIQDCFMRHPALRLVGGEPDLRISESLVTFPVALQSSRYTNRSPHVVLRQDDMLWTSFSMFFQKR